MTDDYTATSYDEIRSRADARRTTEKSAFRLGESIERSALQVIGGWENLTAEVKWAQFHASGSPGTSLPPKVSLPKAIRIVAEDYQVRWPHNAWCAKAAEVSKLRNRLAHLIYVEQVTGERPDRVMYFVSVRDLSFRDEIWSQQTRFRDQVSETELGEALGSVEWMIKCISWMRRLGHIYGLPGSETWDPNHNMAKANWMWIPWWRNEWGTRDNATIPAIDLRLSDGEMAVIRAARKAKAADPTLNET